MVFPNEGMLSLGTTVEVPANERIDHRRHHGYTQGMKTAVSIPDDIFERAERLARGAGRSRSDVFTAALREYVAKHSPDEVTEGWNRVCEEVGEQPEDFVAAAGRRILKNTKW